MKQTRVSILTALIISVFVLFIYGNSLLFFAPSTPNSSKTISSNTNASLSPASFSNSISTSLSIEDFNANLIEAIPADSCFVAKSSKTSKVDIADVNSDKELIPASSMKLVTAAIVLSVFSKDDTLATNIYGEVKNSKITNAVLSTSGDPSFVSDVKPDFGRPKYFDPEHTHSFTDLASTLAKKNVSNISTLTIDSSWLNVPAADTDWAYEKQLVGAIGAIIVNEGFDANGVSQNPESSAAQNLVDVFADKGITIGQVQFAKSGSDLSLINDSKLLASTNSATIENLISDMLKTSNNIYAEQLLIASAHKEQGQVTKESLIAFATSKIASLIKNHTGIVFTNGSGYSKTARISCDQEMEAISVAQSKGVDLVSLSSKANEDGTLTIRFANYKGKLQAKTGTLDGVTALVGQLGQYRFAFLGNGQFGNEQGHEYQEKVVNLLNKFPRWTDIKL